MKKFSEILDFIKILFKKILNKDAQLNLPNNTENTQVPSNALDYLKVDNSIYDLKIALENGNKTISDLSDEELQKLIQIYDEQINKLEKQIAYKKSKLSSNNS